MTRNEIKEKALMIIKKCKGNSEEICQACFRFDKNQTNNLLEGGEKNCIHFINYQDIKMIKKAARI